MGAKKQIVKYLLEGGVINCRNIHTLFGLTNAARELPRIIEAPFSVILERTKKTGLTRFKESCYWYDYSLPHNEVNKSGIKKMKKYING